METCRISRPSILSRELINQSILSDWAQGGIPQSREASRATGCLKSARGYKFIKNHLKSGSRQTAGSKTDLTNRIRKKVWDLETLWKPQLWSRRRPAKAASRATSRRTGSQFRSSSRREGPRNLSTRSASEQRVSTKKFCTAHSTNSLWQATWQGALAGSATCQTKLNHLSRPPAIYQNGSLFARPVYCSNKSKDERSWTRPNHQFLLVIAKIRLHCRIKNWCPPNSFSSFRIPLLCENGPWQITSSAPLNQTSLNKWTIL